MAEALQDIFEDEFDGSSEHNVQNPLLKPLANFGIAPKLVQFFDDPSGIKLTTTCHYAVEVIAMMREEIPTARQHGSAASDPFPLGDGSPSMGCLHADTPTPCD